MRLAARPRRASRWALMPLLFGALVAALPCAARAQSPASSYSKGGGGTKVLYLFLEDLGYRMRRIFSARDLDGGAGKPAMDVALLVGAVDRKNALKALAWARSGKLLILALPLSTAEGHCKEVSFGDLTIPREFDPGSKGAPHAEIDPKLKLRAAACLVKAPPGARVLASTKKGALLFERALGKGKLLVLAHDNLLINFNLDDDDLAVILRRWLKVNAKAHARIAYFEHHQGGAFFKMLREAHLLPFFLQGLLFLAFVLWKITPRFGDAGVEPWGHRRAFAEHARALGTLYQRAGASGYALAQIYDRFVRRLRYREGGAAAHTGDAHAGDGAALVARERAILAERLATRTGRDAEDVESLLAQVEYTAGPEEKKDARGVQRDFRLASAISALAREAGMGEHAGRPRRGREGSRR